MVEYGTLYDMNGYSDIGFCKCLTHYMVFHRVCSFLDIDLPHSHVMEDLSVLNYNI